ncbi:transmembrane protein 187 isoform X1 [Camelus dromedarius]|uniref:transmembrane protein 187 isoform X1 n=2 Tax=Camelus dromedarius TaxID=9838 RepID=UPI0031199C0C
MVIAGLFAPILAGKMEAVLGMGFLLTALLNHALFATTKEKGKTVLPWRQPISRAPSLLPPATSTPGQGHSICVGDHGDFFLLAQLGDRGVFGKNCSAEFGDNCGGSCSSHRGFSMQPESGRALFHVAVASCLCAAAIHTGAFDGVSVQVGLEHYAEAPVAGLPAFLAMPFNSLVNLAYVLLGAYWLQRKPSTPGCPPEVRRACYLKDVFAGMALVYGPVQWLRVASQTRPAAVLDQWLTLPIFAWPVAWCLYLDRGWKPWLFLAVEGLSLCSYGLALLHPCGFEFTLGAHIAAAVGQALCTQGRRGSPSSGMYLALGVLCCLGFVVLKLYDHQLAQWCLFQRLTGHFWSKVCDMLQFHFAFLFLTNVNACRRHPTAGKMH